MLGGEAITSIALVLHELATNALKYGAFSTSSGKVSLSWSVEKDSFELCWQERGGPKIDLPPAEEGFGTLLARRSVEGQLSGSLHFTWDTEGMEARISAPVELLSV